MIHSEIPHNQCPGDIASSSVCFLGPFELSSVSLAGGCLGRWEERGPFPCPAVIPVPGRREPRGRGRSAERCPWCCSAAAARRAPAVPGQLSTRFFKCLAFLPLLLPEHKVFGNNWVAKGA